MAYSVERLVKKKECAHTSMVKITSEIENTKKSMLSSVCVTCVCVECKYLNMYAFEIIYSHSHFFVMTPKEFLEMENKFVDIENIFVLLLCYPSCWTSLSTLVSLTLRKGNMAL